MKWLYKLGRFVSKKAEEFYRSRISFYNQKLIRMRALRKELRDHVLTTSYGPELEQEELEKNLRNNERTRNKG